MDKGDSELLKLVPFLEKLVELVGSHKIWIHNVPINTESILIL